MTTMIADPPSSASRLDAGLRASRTSPNPAAWKQAIGTKPIAARLAVLPEAKPAWKRMGISAGVQLGLLIFCLMIPFFYPERIKTALNFTPLEVATPRTEIPVAPPPPKVRVKTPAPPPEVVQTPKLDPRVQHVFLQPKALQPKVQAVEAKAPDMNPVLEAAKMETAVQNQPKRPREEVKLNNLNTGSAAPATVVAPVEKVQTGGFGDPTGLAGKGDPKHANMVNRLGSPALPGGLGYGNGTGGDKGIRGTVASTGFGNGIATPPPSGCGHGSVRGTGFGDQSVVAEAPKKKPAPSGDAEGTVSILSKPRPEYTQEGRNLKLEGDVVLELVFLANGAVHVNRVVSGLGHGLDESAIRAAEQIKFKPAKRDGQPVDFPARVRIEFRLAY
jgi:TonB family protein